MRQWIQLDLFTGEPIETFPVQTRKEYTPKTKRLALEVQLSIARMDNVYTTLNIVNELCEKLTGITSQVFSHTVREKVQRVIKTDTPKRKRGRPKGSSGQQQNITERNDEIRKQYFSHGKSQAQLVDAYNLSPATINNIIHKKRGQR